MLDHIPILSTASALARHAGARTEGTARNLANADTPGWRPLRASPFDPGAPGLRATRPDHLGGSSGAAVEWTLGAATKPNGNGVSVEAEMVEAARARADHGLALGAWRGAMDVLRASVATR
ncbi:flagellar basal-body rod protein FlgB [Hasllibacter halocynthiae]|uniref:Flagellar basal-body rod protein FlgB n=1 Tax=Hasllibacter halocynthiae TaxID=595589 RepID=A0A2T0X2P4_9RHOB|nr:hypothetical protein [Hasllibacter halocynthiae]PRY93216.1 flagellar basal-body rod protein FlgB [Hasllibacter halocynthiae]